MKSILRNTLIFVFLINLSCSTSSKELLSYKIIEYQDYNYSVYHRMKCRVVLLVNIIPSKDEMMDVSTHIWKSGNKKWDEFTVHLYLEGMIDYDIAYCSITFTKEGFKDIIILEPALMNSRWEELLKKSKPQNPESLVKEPKTDCTPDALLSLIVGEWYEYSEYRKSIIIDYIKYSISDMKTIKTIKTDDEIVSQYGSFMYNDEFKAIEVKIVKGDAGIQATYWRPDEKGAARIIYWRNLTLGHESERDELWIKKDSFEWDKRKKLALSDL